MPEADAYRVIIPARHHPSVVAACERQHQQYGSDHGAGPPIQEPAPPSVPSISCCTTTAISTTMKSFVSIILAHRSLIRRQLDIERARHAGCLVFHTISRCSSRQSISSNNQDFQPPPPPLFSQVCDLC
jgi:hypothetical protein